MSWNSWEDRPIYHRQDLHHCRVSVVRVPFHILIGLLHTKKPSSNSAPCCFLPDLTDPLWLHVGCRSCSERNGRSDKHPFHILMTCQDESTHQLGEPMCRAFIT